MSTEEKKAAIQDMYEDYREGFPDVPEIDPHALAKAIEDESVVVVDVRDPREWAVSRIPGAIPKSEFEANKVTYKDRPIVAYCTVGYRSGQFAKSLNDEGFQASNLSGSILAWAHAGQSLVDDQGETRKVHVYGPQWNLLPDGYEPVW